MATMNVSLPDAMKDWVEHQVESLGRYSNVSDYVRDLIRKEQDQTQKIAVMQQLATEGLESGLCDVTMDDIRAIALEQIEASKP